jgi:geranylgeranyl diphosphate synthase, type II
MLKLDDKNVRAFKVLDEYKQIIWPEIDNYLSAPLFPRQFRVTQKYQKEVDAAHWNVVREYPERKGKYIRPSIVMLIAEAMGAKRESALKTAAAMQLSEEWLLIHDDFEDKSMMRRGKETLQRKYSDELAVNAGDTLHIIMWKVLTDNFKLLGENKSIEILNEFYTMLSRTALGQAVEIKWMQENKEKLNDDDWFFIGDGKTGYYSMAGPSRLGGIVAGANKREVDSISEFGLYLGRCFQLVDDILDITTDFSGLKQQGNDIYEGKRTLLLGHLTRNTNHKDAETLKAILDKPRDKKSQDEVKWVIDKMYQYKTIDYAQGFAKKFKEKSEYIFDTKLSFIKREPARSNIKTLIDFILERKY